MISIAPNRLRLLKLNELINLLNVKTFRVLDKERSAKIPHAGMVSESERFAKGGLFRRTRAARKTPPPNRHPLKAFKS